MEIPWPSVYFAIMGALSFVNLNFTNFPVVSCVQQRMPAFRFFEAMTASLLAFLGLIALTWLVGRRHLQRKGASAEEVRTFSRLTLSKVGPRVRCACPSGASAIRRRGCAAEQQCRD